MSRTFRPLRGIPGSLAYLKPSTYEPPEPLRRFLDVWSATVYICFRKDILGDVGRLARTVIEAVQKAGIRAVVSKGWGGSDIGEVPDNIFILGDTPLDWLLPRLHGVAHDGDKKLTALSTRLGIPAVIAMPANEQDAWNKEMTRACEVEPIAFHDLTPEALAKAILRCISEEATSRARHLAADLERELLYARRDVDDFHSRLPLLGRSSIRCGLLPDRVSVWTTRQGVPLSALAAVILVREGKLQWADLKLRRDRMADEGYLQTAEKAEPCLREQAASLHPSPVSNPKHESTASLAKLLGFDKVFWAARGNRLYPTGGPIQDVCHEARDQKPGCGLTQVMKQAAEYTADVFAGTPNAFTHFKKTDHTESAATQYETWIRLARIEQGQFEARQELQPADDLGASRLVRKTSQTDGPYLGSTRLDPSLSKSASLKQRVQRSWTSLERHRAGCTGSQRGEIGPRRTTDIQHTSDRRPSSTNDWHLREGYVWQEYEEVERRRRVLDRNR